MKKLFSLLLCAVLLLSLATVVSAAAPKIVDEVDLLTDEQEALLEEKAQSLTDSYGIDVVIVTNWSLGMKTAEQFADDYFDNNGYGVGSDHSGVLFLLSMEYRDWWVSTTGKGIYALTDYGIESVFSEIAYYLSTDQYYYAFDEYLDQLGKYFQALSEGDPIDGYHGSYEGPGSYSPGTQEDVVHYGEQEDPGLFGYLFYLLIALGSGAAAGGIGLGMMRSKMHTAVSQQHATSYMQSGSYNLTQQQNVFLYQRVNRIRRAEPSRSSGHHMGGGSSIHIGGGGRPHGGGGGKF